MNTIRLRKQKRSQHWTKGKEYLKLWQRLIPNIQKQNMFENWIEKASLSRRTLPQPHRQGPPPHIFQIFTDYVSARLMHI